MSYVYNKLVTGTKSKGAVFWFEVLGGDAKRHKKPKLRIREEKRAGI